MQGLGDRKIAVGVIALVVAAGILLPGLQQPPSAYARPHRTRTPAQTPALTSTRTSSTTPAFDHIFVITEENQSYAAVIGSSSAPYLNSLARRNGVATNYYGISHPSLPNYLALTGGSTFGITNDCQPTDCPVNARNLADTIGGAGKTWKAYMQSMPAPCTLGHSGEYTPRHNPFVYYVDIQSNATRCDSHVVPYTALARDLASAQSTPNLLWISPNVCDDMHDCSIATGDSWLQNNLPTIFNSPAWKTQNSVLFVIWDEASGGNHVPMLVIGPAVKPGYRSAGAYNHYSLLRTIEVAWGLPSLTTNDANARPMSDFWR